MYYERDFVKKHGGLYVENTWAGNTLEKQIYSFMLMVYIAHGSGKLHIDNKDHEINEGDIVLINPDVELGFYSVIQNRSLSMYCCCFDEKELNMTRKEMTEMFPELTDFFNRSVSHIALHDTSKNDIRNYMIRMIDDYLYLQPGYRYAVKGLLSAAAVMSFRICINERIKQTPVNTDIIVGALSNYVNKNIYKKIRVGDIAEILHLSPDYMCRVFKKHMNISFSDFVLVSRVNKIRDALENTDRPIYKICEDFDFTPQYLNRIFKKNTGLSMTEYKKRYNYKSDNLLYKL